jgi:hypothetical protein
MNMALRIARSHGHLNQFYYLRRCWDQFKDVNTVHGFKYDYFIRLRDDAFVFENFETFETFETFEIFIPLNVQLPLVEASYTPIAIFPSCESWEGLNDKAAVVNRAAAQDYFSAPLGHFHTHWEVFKKNQQEMINQKYLNPEKFIKAVYKVTSLQVIQSTNKVPVMSSMAVPVGTLRSHPKNTTCLRVAGTGVDTLGCYYNSFPASASTLESLLWPTITTTTTTTTSTTLPLLVDTSHWEKGTGKFCKKMPKNCRRVTSARNVPFFWGGSG